MAGRQAEGHLRVAGGLCWLEAIAFAGGKSGKWFTLISPAVRGEGFALEISAEVDSDSLNT